jgi:hypothetical protein
VAGLSSQVAGLSAQAGQAAADAASCRACAAATAARPSPNLSTLGVCVAVAPSTLSGSPVITWVSVGPPALEVMAMHLVMKIIGTAVIAAVVLVSVVALHPIAPRPRRIWRRKDRSSGNHGP